MAIAEEHHAKPVQPAPEPSLAGYVARFEDVPSLLAAAEKTRDAGFSRFDCYTPFPVHGIDEAMGTKPTRLPFIVLGCAAMGATTAIALQYFTNAFDYKYIISGKPFFSIPSDMPVTFELAVLFSAFGALLGMLALNNLPRLYNKMFLIDPFAKVTTDGFFLGIEEEDPKFHPEETAHFLNSLHPVSVDPCMDPHESEALPQILLPLAAFLLIVGLIPLVLVARMRAMPSNVPRIEILTDMDFQPKLKTQRLTHVFADDRGMRPEIPGTLARGDFYADISFSEGLQTGVGDEVDRTQLLPNAKNPDGTTVNLSQVPWVSEFPLTVNAELMARGQERYDIYCAVCHGLTGKGDGLVTQRAMQLQAASPSVGTWIKPISLYDGPIKSQPVGQLFNTITYGVRKMPGYASQITIEDRWAIVLYLRALQQAGSGTIDSIPAEEQQRLRAEVTPE
ncbi:MAG: DUF3341 domain-containing protein [Planctomycetaceae bacterium]|nr:DUF3341 domain-containing protein [Planctomycetaceae bacterium]